MKPPDVSDAVWRLVEQAMTQGHPPRVECRATAARVAAIVLGGRDDRAA